MIPIGVAACTIGTRHTSNLNTSHTRGLKLPTCTCSVVLREGGADADSAPAPQWADDSHWARVSWSLIGQRGRMRVLPPTLHVARADADGNVLVRGAVGF